MLFTCFILSSFFWIPSSSRIEVVLAFFPYISLEHQRQCEAWWWQHAGGVYCLSRSPVLHSPSSFPLLLLSISSHPLIFFSTITPSSPLFFPPFDAFSAPPRIYSSFLCSPSFSPAVLCPLFDFVVSSSSSFDVLLSSPAIHSPLLCFTLYFHFLSFISSSPHILSSPSLLSVCNLVLSSLFNILSAFLIFSFCFALIFSHFYIFMVYSKGSKVMTW